MNRGHNLSKLKQKEILAALAIPGITQREVADHYKVSQGTVSNINKKHYPSNPGRIENQTKKEILEALAIPGVTQKEVAAHFGISLRSVSSIKNNHRSKFI